MIKMKVGNLMVNYGSTLKLLRESKGTSQKNLAEEILSPSHLSKFENGKHSISLEIFFDLLNKMNVTVNEFIVYHEDKSNFDVTPKSWS